MSDETAKYGMVSACYFALFMYRYKQGRIFTDTRAMVNVGVLFMLAQPLCRILQGNTGFYLFVFMCMSSIVMMPTPEDHAREREAEVKWKERQERKKSKKDGGAKNEKNRKKDKKKD